MKILDINIIRSINQNCIRNSLITLAGYLSKGTDYRHFYADAWDFVYKGDQVSFYDEVSCNNNNDYEIFEKHFGIKSINRRNISSDVFFSEVISEIDNNRPLMINSDMFYTPFSKGYNIRHHDHISIISGYNEENNSVYIVDVYDTIKNFEVRLENFYEFISEYWIFKELDFQNENTDYLFMIDQQMTNILNKKNKGNIFDKIRCLASDIVGNDNFRNEICNFKVESWDNIITNLLLLRGTRMQYIEFLMFAQEKLHNEIYHDSILKLTQCLNNWEILLGLLRKSSMCENKYDMLIQRASKKLVEIADYEERIANDIKNAINKGATIRTDRQENEKFRFDPSNMSQLPLEISGYFNCKAFHTSKSSNITANFSPPNFIFIDVDLFNIENNIIKGIKTSDGIGYDLFVFQDNNYDNLICDNQNITVPSDKYKAISILGCAESGASADCLEVFYDNNSQQKQKFEFNDWAGKNLFGAEEIIELPAHKEISKTVSKRLYNISLWSQTYAFDSTRQLIGFKLPDYPNIHIFAITLIK